jgi:hypothetical protein
LCGGEYVPAFEDDRYGLLLNRCRGGVSAVMDSADQDLGETQ